MTFLIDFGIIIFFILKSRIRYYINFIRYLLFFFLIEVPSVNNVDGNKNDPTDESDDDDEDVLENVKRFFATKGKFNYTIYST